MDQEAASEFPNEMTPCSGGWVGGIFCGHDKDSDDDDDNDFEEGGPKIELWIAWTVFLLAILLEVCGTVCMKMSDGFSKPIPSVLVYVFYALSLAAFSIALQGIELSTAYAIWSGLGTCLTALIGIVYFQDTVNWAKILSLIVITVGCVAIKYSDGLEEEDNIIAVSLPDDVMKSVESQSLNVSTDNGF